MTEPTTLRTPQGGTADQGGTFFVRTKGEVLMCCPLKPALPYDEQVERLRDVHGLEIPDHDEAVRILSRVNYYRLSAYGIGLYRRDDRERFADGVSLRMLYRLYRFDLQFRNLLLPAIEAIEIELRTKIAYHLAITYGSEGYTDARNFTDFKKSDGSSVHQTTIEKFHDEVRRQQNLPFVRHHLQKYGGHFPIWVAVELFTFGMVSSLYKIMKTADREAVAQCYGEQAIYLGSWILALVDIRNRCAHYGRIYNMPLAQTPRLHKEHEAFKHSKKIYPVLFVIQRLLNDRPEWPDFIEGLAALLAEYPEAKLNFMDFPENWKQLLGL